MAKKNTKTKKVTELSQRELDRLAIKAQRYTVAHEVKEVKEVKEVIKEVKREIVVDHIVITRFRNDKEQPTLFATAKGEFVSVDNKEDFAKANEKGTLKLTLEEASTIVNAKDFDAKDIEVSPAFTVEQFKALIAE